MPPLRRTLPLVLLLLAAACRPGTEEAVPAGASLWEVLQAGTLLADGSVLELQQEPAAEPSLAAVLDGWGEREAWGAWALGDGAAAMLYLPAARPAELYLEAFAAEHPDGRPQRVTVAVNGRRAGELQVAPESLRTYRLAVPAELLRRGANRLDLGFAFHTPEIPGVDLRPRALAVRRLALVTPGSVPPPPVRPAWRPAAAREIVELRASGTFVAPLRVPATAGELELGVGLRGDLRPAGAGVRLGLLTAAGEEHLRPLEPAALAAGARQRLDLTAYRGRWVFLLVQAELAADARLILRAPRLEASPPSPPSPPAAVAPPPSLPDLVLIVLDAARADHFGVYGYPRPTTPEIDRLAAQGWVFSRLISECPYTACAATSLLTGVPFTDHGVVDRRLRLRPEIDALAERLDRLGYLTLAYSANPNDSRAMGLDQGFDEFHELWRLAPQEAASLPPAGRKKRRADPHPERLTSRVEGRLAAGLGEDPLFLFLHYVPPHEPYDPDPEFDLFGDPAYRGPVTPDRQLMRAIYQGRIRLSAADLERLVALYDGNLRMADAHVARVLAALERAGRLERAWVVITADHGEAFMEHGAVGHNTTLYDEMLHVPLIVRPPAGAAVAPPDLDRLASLYDLAPTLLQAAGAPPGGSGGRSLLAPPGERFGERSGERFGERFIVLRSGHREQPLYGLRGERFKLIVKSVRHATGPGLVEPRLYDLLADPGETADLAHRRPLLTAALRLLLERSLSAPSSAEAHRQELSEDERRTLEALGYL